MKLIEDFNTVPSLSFLTAFWTIVSVWNRNDIARSIKKCFNNKHADAVESNWFDVEDEVTAAVQSSEDIPHELVENIKGMITLIGKQIYETLFFIYFSAAFRNFGNKLPVICWTSYGAVDTKRVEKLLVQDIGNDICFRYILACNDCFKQNIEELFHVLTVLEKDRFLKVRKNRELISYWTHRMSDDLSSFKELTEKYDKNMKDYDYSADQFAFLHTLLTGNKSGIKYFLNYLPRKEYELVLKNHLFFVPPEYGKRTIFPYGLRPRPQEHYEDAMYFLMLKLSKDKREEIFLIDAYCILHFFINYPFFGVFSRYVKLFVDSLAWNQISWFLSEIIRYEKSKTPLFGLKLFSDLWSMCPESVKEDIKSNSKNSKWYGEKELSLLLKRIKEAEESCPGKHDVDVQVQTSEQDSL